MLPRHAEYKTKLVETVSSNPILKDGSLCFDYKRPFDLLAEGSLKDKWWTLAAEYRTFFIQNPQYELNYFRDLVAA
jgi:hypothetical protein